MKSFLLLTGLATLGSLVALTTNLAAAAEVTVHLVSGRSYTAEISEQTSSDRLWLEFRTENTTLLRPIAWNRVAGAEYAGRELTKEAFQRGALALAAMPREEQAAEVEVPSPLTTEPNRGAPRTSMAENALEVLQPATRVESVQINAFAANWDSDVDNDGLVVQVTPVDRFGQVVLVHGSVQVELIGVRDRYGRNVPPDDRSRVVERIGQWTRQITPESYDSYAASFRLPFQALHPEFNTQVGSYGLVHVRLVVPGEGVFEASLDNVRTRPLGVIRSILQRDEADRFFHTERTSRGQRE